MIARLSAIFAVAALLLGAGCEKPAPSGAAPVTRRPGAAPTERIAVVPKGTTHEFWKSVHAGAAKAGTEFGVEIVFRGPEREDDREQQISLVQSLVSAKYSAIVLAPLDETALIGPSRDAMNQNIPVVIIDSALKGEAGKDFVSFVATDNYKGGRLAAERLKAAMGGKGKALLLRYAEGSASTGAREQGFVDAITEGGGIELVDPKRYAGVTRATAQDAAEALLSSNSDIAGVFTPNESSTFGMLLALRSRGMAGKVAFVGFDASDAAVEGLRKGELAGIVLQSPLRMGYLGVKTAVEKLRGIEVDANVDTGVTLATKDNLDSPELRELLAPDFSALQGK